MGKRPVEAFPVGEYLTEELEERGWTQQEFAAILGRPVQFVSEVISGKKELTRESAAQIGAAFGTSAELWLNIQTKYQLWELDRDENHRKSLSDVELRARLRTIAPMAELRRRGFVTGPTPSEEAAQVCSLLGMDSLDGTPRFRAAARRSNADAELSSVQFTWLGCAHQVAAELAPTAPFDRDGLRTLAADLSRSVATPAAFEDLPARFAAVGVKLVYVDAFAGSKIDGAAFAADDGALVIALSGRGKRYDKVLFSLLHECAHVVLGHVDGSEAVIDDFDDPVDDAGREADADNLAATWALPDGIPEPPGKVTQAWINTTAEHAGVAPIVVVGRLQKVGRIPWRSALAKNAPSVTEHLARW